MRKGFTLIEILIAIMIMIVLVTIAVPMYERAVEKSRVTDARTTLKRIYDAKRQVMDAMQMQDASIPDVYSSTRFGFENLGFSLDCPQGTTVQNNHIVSCATQDFVFFMQPLDQAQSNAVCAVRRTGDYAGVNFIYRGEETNDVTVKFQCQDGGVADGCEVYGMPSAVNNAFCVLPQ